MGFRLSITGGAFALALLTSSAHAQLVLPGIDVWASRSGGITGAAVSTITAEDIARAVAFLLSEDAAYVTGQTLSVNGGMYM